MKTGSVAMRFRIMVLVGVFVTIFFGSRLIALGTSDVIAPKGELKCFTSIQIESGDTLWSIAKAHMGSEYEKTQEFIDEIKSINRLNSDKIHVGQYLTVPYYVVAAD
jgi:LysM repeat protein